MGWGWTKTQHVRQAPNCNLPEWKLYLEDLAVGGGDEGEQGSPGQKWLGKVQFLGATLKTHGSGARYCPCLKYQSTRGMMGNQFRLDMRSLVCHYSGNGTVPA